MMEDILVIILNLLLNRVNRHNDEKRTHLFKAPTSRVSVAALVGTEPPKDGWVSFTVISFSDSAYQSESNSILSLRFLKVKRLNKENYLSLKSFQSP